jgi:uncharacterized protein YecE (DUF72 family)
LPALPGARAGGEESGVSIFVGTAAWTIPAHLKGEFPPEGSHLARYARVFDAVEINSSFYRDHKPETYARWAAAVPAHFRFAVKLSRYFTQEMRLRETGARLGEVLAGIAELGPKWGFLLVQLPPSLDFVKADAARFLKALRRHYKGALAWEPRHLSWASARAVALLDAHGVTKVVADPERCPWPPEQMARQSAPAYFRLHGSPEIYRSQYSPEYLARVSASLTALARKGRDPWCIFDNTTFGHATADALATLRQVRGHSTMTQSVRAAMAAGRDIFSRARAG